MDLDRKQPNMHLLHLVKASCRAYLDAIEKSRGKSSNKIQDLARSTETSLLDLFSTKELLKIEATGQHPAVLGDEREWSELPDDGLIGKFASAKIDPFNPFNICIGLYPQGLDDEKLEGLVWYVSLRDIYYLETYYPYVPIAADDPVKAMSDMRDAYIDFLDKLLKVAETDQDLTVIRITVALVKNMFLGLQDTYKDDKGETHASTVADAIELTIFATDNAGDKQSFGLLLNELEAFGSGWEVREEWSWITGKTFGDLLRGAVMRLLIQHLIEDDEVWEVQSRRMRLAEEANLEAGINSTSAFPLGKAVQGQDFGQQVIDFAERRSKKNPDE